MQRTLRRWLRAKHIIIIALCALLTVACSSEDGDGPNAPDGYDANVMALIPAGTFRMGNITAHADGDSNEIPIHQVTLTRSFLMARKEVTQALYEAVMGTNPSYFKGPNLPVEQVTWYDAVEFCNELSRQQGLKPCYSGSDTSIACDFAANGYRLPTEAEWEYACRAGTETDFYSGNMRHSGYTPLDSTLDRAGWYQGNSEPTTHPVGERKANAFGLYDMHGNVIEWCWDWLASGYYTSSPADNPRGAASGFRRVCRGGCWFSPASYCRSAFRNSAGPLTYYPFCGFRVVRTY